MDSLKILHILLMFISLQDITGVQFKHFPITIGRSESNLPRKFQPRLRTPPTRLPPSSNDINPYHVRYFQDEEEARAFIEPTTIDRRPTTIDHRPIVIDHRPNTIDHRPSTIDRALTTIEGFDNRRQPVTQGPTHERPVAIEVFDNRRHSANQTPDNLRSTAIEGFDKRGQLVSQVGHRTDRRTGLFSKFNASRRLTVQGNNMATTQSRVTKKSKQPIQKERASEEERVRNHRRWQLKNKNRQLNAPRRQVDQVKISQIIRNRKLAERRRFNNQQRYQETDYTVVTERNFNRARSKPSMAKENNRQLRPAKNNNKQVPSIGQRRSNQIDTKVQSKGKDHTIKELRSFDAVPVVKPLLPKQILSISKPVEINEIFVTDQRQRGEIPPKNVGIFPNFKPTNIKRKQHIDVALKQKITEKNIYSETKKSELASLLNATFVSESIGGAEDKSSKAVPITTLAESKQITLTKSDHSVSDNNLVKLVPGAVWLNGKKVWETSFLVRDGKEEPRIIKITPSQINIDIAMKYVKTTWDQDPYRKEKVKNNKPRNAFFEIGKPTNENKESESKQFPAASNSLVNNSQDRNIVTIRTPIRTQPSKQEPLRIQPSIKLTTKPRPSFQSSQIEHTNEKKFEQNKHRKNPQNIKIYPKLQFEKRIKQSTFIRQTPTRSTARTPVTNTPQIRIQPTQASFINSLEQASFINPPTQISFRNPPTLAPFRNPPNLAPFRNQPTLAPFRNSQTQVPLKNLLTQTSFINSPTQANIALDQIGFPRKQAPETTEVDFPTFLPLSLNHDFDDLNTITIGWGK